MKKNPDLVCVVDVAGEGGPDNVGFLVNDLDDVRPDLVGLVLDDGGVWTVVHVQIQELA